MPTVLVTGGSGFIGKAVTRSLCEAGWNVRLLLRDPNLRPSALKVEIVRGDVREPATIARAVGGVDAVCHMAADYRLWARNPADIYATNVAGTLNVMRAALSARIPRVLHMSSVAAVRPQPGRSADETSLLEEKHAIGTYKHSKLVAENGVMQLVGEAGLPAIIVNPSTPVGPGDSRPTPTGRLVLAAAQGRVPAFVDTGLNIVHVDDVAAGCVSALQHGRIGERYILGGDDVHLRDILAEIAALVGRRPPVVRLSPSIAMPIAAVSEWISRITGAEPLATRDGVRMARRHMFFSSDKARRELGYAPRDHRIALQDAVAWFEQEGLLQARGPARQRH